MSYFFPADLSHSFNGQPPRSPLAKPLSHNSLYNNTHDHVFSYFPLFPAKSNIIQEDPYFCPFTPISHPSTDYSAQYDLQTFGTLQSPAIYPQNQTKQNKPPRLSFNLDSNVTSLGSLSEIPTLEPFREQNNDKNQSFFVDSYLCTQEEAPLESLARPMQETLSFQIDSFIEKDFETSQGSPQLFSSPSERTETTESPGKSIFARPDLKGWNEEDEKLLRKLAVQYKFDWKKVAKKFANKKYTPHFLKMRYKGYDEGPVPKRVKFTHEEDLMIAKYFDLYGVDWEKMVAHFPNRTAIMIKNRFYSYIRKNNRLENLLQEAGLRTGPGNQEENCEKDACKEELTPASENGNMGNLLSIENENIGKKADENALLRAQLKSLKSLYLVTYRELSKLKKQSEK